MNIVCMCKTNVGRPRKHSEWIERVREKSKLRGVDGIEYMQYVCVSLEPTLEKVSSITNRGTHKKNKFSIENYRARQITSPSSES